MKKSIFLSIALLILPLFAFAQISISKGSPYKTYKGGFMLYFQSGDEMLSFKRDGAIFIIQKYNTKTLVQTSVNIYKDILEDYPIVAVMEYNKRYFLFYSVDDKRNKVTKLFSREIDFATGTFIGVGNAIVTVEGALQSGFFIYTSYNNNKLLVRYLKYKKLLNDDINHDTMGLYVFDKNMIPVWNTEVELPYAEKYLQRLSQTVDSDGTVYLLIRAYDKKTVDAYGLSSEKAAHHLEILKLTNGNKIFDKSIFTLSKEKSLTDINIVEILPAEILCVGFYKTEGAKTSSLFTCKVNADGSAGEDMKYDLPEEIIRQYENKKDKNIKPNKKIPNIEELNNLVCTTIQKDKNGDLFIVAECQNHYSVKGDEMDFSDPYSYYLVHYDDMLAIRIDAQNHLKWMKRLPKRPYKNGSALSYKLITRENFEYIIFQDHEENRNLTLEQMTAERFSSTETVLFAYKINKSDGHTEKITLLDAKNVDGKEVYRITTERVMEASASELIVEVYKKNEEDVLIKIKGVE
ncbi:MAG: hypothetical protein K0R51_589 [Cytophagaceae bacterium]|jgi:hypothetical protein|nr:hypothetical protein [Cytophagaceae bacterium]